MYSITNITGRDYHPSRPLAVMVEPSSQCNLKCPLCAAGIGQVKRLKTELDFEHYKKLIDSYSSHLLYVLLFNQGEPFINRRFLDMVRYSNERNVYTITSTNGHYIRNEQEARKIVESGLDEIRISLDGLTPEVYNTYRIGGDFSRVIEGIKMLVEARGNLKTFTPIIELQILLTSDTEKQLGETKQFGERLGVDIISAKTLQLLDTDDNRKFLPSDRKYWRYDENGNKLVMRGKIRNRCRRLYFQMQVNSDSMVVPCCFDKQGNFVFGDISNGNPNDIWTGKKFNKFRNRILENRPAIKICNNCTEGIDNIYSKKWYIS